MIYSRSEIETTEITKAMQTIIKTIKIKRLIKLVMKKQAMMSLYCIKSIKGKVMRLSVRFSLSSEINFCSQKSKLLVSLFS
jgi:hypothetical protein